MIEILPAITVPDGYWTGIWAKFVKDGTAETVFCDGEIADAEAFASMMNYVFVHPHIILYDGALAAVVWLTDLEGKMCRGHFVVFRQFWKKSRHIGSAMRQWLLEQKDSSGNFFFDVLVGMIPASNRPAVNVAIKAGFRHSGTIPNGAWIAKERRSVDMVLLTATRED